MLTELHGKAGQVCRYVKTGQVRCPLIVRPTSEDVITGHLCEVFRALNPRWWLPDILNVAVRAQRFRRQVFRHLKIEPWRNRSRYLHRQCRVMPCRWPVDLCPHTLRGGPVSILSMSARRLLCDKFRIPLI